MSRIEVHHDDSEGRQSESATVHKVETGPLLLCLTPLSERFAAFVHAATLVVTDGQSCRGRAKGARNACDSVIQWWLGFWGWPRFR